MLVPITDCADWRLPDAQFLAAFQLPTKGSGELARRHPIPRESRITFGEATHTYKVDGKIVPRSVTGLLHEYASSFDPALALIAMKSGRDWEAKRAALEEQGLGTSDEDFLQRWERNGEVARARGHLLHWQAEQMCNGRPVEEPHSLEFKQACQIYERLLERGMRPFRAEVNLFHVGLRLAGQPDLLMLDTDGNIVIVDWKRSKEIRYENNRGALQYPLAHLPDSNYWLYSLQLNVYRYMLGP